MVDADHHLTQTPIVLWDVPDDDVGSVLGAVDLALDCGGNLIDVENAALRVDRQVLQTAKPLRRIDSAMWQT